MELTRRIAMVLAVGAGSFHAKAHGQSVIGWTATTALPRGVDHHATFTTVRGDSGVVLHVLGGNDYREQFATHWMTDVAADGSLGAWREGVPLPAPTAGLTVLVSQDNRWAVALGGQHPGRQNTAEVFVAPVLGDGSLGAWVAGPPLPAARFHHAAVASGDYLYVLGGLEATTSSNTVFRARVAANGTLGPWVALDTMPRPRSHQAAFVSGGAIYQIGGLDGNPAGANTPLRDVLRASVQRDGSLGPWTVAGAMDSAYGTHGAFAFGGNVFVVGGVENNARFSDAVQRAPFRADGTVGPFERLAPLPRPRGHVHHLPVVGGRVYSAGGSQSRQVIADVWIGEIGR